MRILFLFTLCFISRFVFGVGINPHQNWQSFDTPHFKFNFVAKNKADAIQLSNIAESVYPHVTQAFNWTPKEKTEVVLSDFTDSANGFATPLPFNHAGIFLSPPTDGELLTNEDWLVGVFLHEFTHIVHLDKAGGIPQNLRNVFGRQLFSFPNSLQPSWLIEGLATWMESREGKRQGRLGNTYFEALMQSEVKLGLKSLAEINANGNSWPFNKAYLYGAYFFKFLEEKYSEKAVFHFVENYSDNFIPFRVNSNPVSITNKNMSLLWEEYASWLRETFQLTKHRKAKSPEIIGKKLVTNGALVRSPTQAADGTLFYVEADGYTQPKLIRLTKKGVRSVWGKVHFSAELRAEDADHVLLIQPEVCHNNDFFNDLYRATSHTLKRLTHCARFRAVAPRKTGQGMVAVLFDSGLFSLVSLTPLGKKEQTLLVLPKNEVVTGIDIAQDNHTLIYTSRNNHHWRLQSFDIPTKAVTTLIKDKAVKRAPRFSKDEESILFIADYNHTYNAWRYNRTSLQLAPITHTYSAVLEASGLSENGIEGLTVLEGVPGKITSLYSYRSEAYMPDMPEPYSKLLADNLLSQDEIRASESEEKQLVRFSQKEVQVENLRAYSPLESLHPRGWLPFGALTDGMQAAGFSLFGQDVLGVHQYTLSPQIEFSQSEFLGTANYLYHQNHLLQLSRTIDVLNTVSNDNKVEISRYDLSSRLDWISAFPYERRDFNFIFAVGGEINHKKRTIVDVSEQTRVDEKVFGAYLQYNSLKSSVFSEGVSEGMKITLLGESYEAFNAYFQGGIVRGDFQHFLSIGKTVLNTYATIANGSKAAEPFELGGAFAQSAIFFNQRDFSLRGYEDGHSQLIGHKLQHAVLEWRVPVMNIDRHLMVPPVGLNRLSALFFYEGGAAFDSGEEEKLYRASGIELLFEVKLFYYLPLPLRIGYAKGLDKTLGKEQIYATLGYIF